MHSWASFRQLPTARSFLAAIALFGVAAVLSIVVPADAASLKTQCLRSCRDGGQYFLSAKNSNNRNVCMGHDEHTCSWVRTPLLIACRPEPRCELHYTDDILRPPLTTVYGLGVQSGRGRLSPSHDESVGSRLSAETHVGNIALVL